MVAFGVVVAVVLSHFLGLALGPRRLVKASAPPRRRSVENTDNGGGTSAEAVEVAPQAPADEAAMVQIPIVVVQEAIPTPEAPPTRRRWLRRSLAGAICLAAIAAAILLASRITGWNGVIFGAWIASGVVLFLPLGAVLRVARRGLRRLPVVRRATPVAAAVAPEPARPAWAQRIGRLSRLALGLALYTAFVSGAMYYTPGILSRALDTEYPMASVTSSSMWPTLEKGDLVILKGVGKPEDIKVGDIIAFEHEGGFAIHRVIQVDGESITTQGDANRIPDDPITFDKVIGRVPTLAGHLVKMPYLGNVGILVHQASDDPGQVEQEPNQAPFDDSAGGQAAEDAQSAAAEEPTPRPSLPTIEPGQAGQEPSEAPFDDSAGSQGPQEAQPAAGEEPPSQPSLPTIEYQVQPGDSLTDIAARFGTTAEVLIQLNGLEDPNAILYGSTLKVPHVEEEPGDATAGVSP
jgi:signal peptidase I